jgi:peptide/nickel transport system substrate-binding protein
VLWARWAINALDPTAERPPPAVLEQLQLYREVRASPSRAGREERMMRILDLTAQEFPVIGLCTADDITGVVSTPLRNVPPVMMSSGRSFLAPAPVNPCQFYLDPPRSDQP